MSIANKSYFHISKFLNKDNKKTLINKKINKIGGCYQEKKKEYLYNYTNELFWCLS